MKPMLLLRRARPIGLGDTGTSHGDQPLIDILIGGDGTVQNLDSAAVPEGTEVLDLKGAYLSAGWVDLHTHIWWGGTDISVRPHDIGASTGVVTLVDAGSAGEANFHGFREFVIEPAREQIFAFLNLGTIGLVAGNRVSELIDHRFINLARTMKVIESNRDIIRGVKVRASSTVLGSWGLEPVKLAKKVAKLAGLPIMVHVGEPPPLLEDIFGILGPGDIVTHCFHGKPAGNLLEDEDLFAWAKRLAESGVVLDIGHGAASFAYKVGTAGLQGGLPPTTISTDLHIRNIGGPVWDLSLVMSKLLALGMPVADIVRAVTTNPLRALGEPAPALAAGHPARFTVFEVLPSELTLPDSSGGKLTMKQRFLPRHAILGRTVVEASSRLPHVPMAAPVLVR
jgi:dihydroorotase